MSLQSSIDKLSHDITLARVLEDLTGVSQAPRIAHLEARLSALEAEQGAAVLEGLAIATAWRESMEIPPQPVAIRYLTPLSDSYDERGRDLGEQRGMFPR